MVKLTIWKPDTCDCVVVNRWDTQDDPPVLTPVVHPKSHVCAAHRGVVPSVSDDKTANDHSAVVLDENVSKNEAVDAVAKALGRAGEDIGWAIDQRTRAVVLAVPASVTPADKARAQAALATVGARRGARTFEVS